MVVAVRFQSKAEPLVAAGKEYHYKLADGLSVETGEWIIVPAGAGHSVAMVTEVGVPDGKIDVRVESRLRTIEEVKRVGAPAGTDAEGNGASAGVGGGGGGSVAQE